MTEELIKQMLSERKCLLDERCEIERQFYEEFNACMPPELKDAMTEVERKQDEVRAKWDARRGCEELDAISAAIQEQAVTLGKSVKYDAGQVVFYHGRVTWDSKKLDGMMALIPQLGEARKVGEPYAVIK